MVTSIEAKFETRREADLAVERLVQEHGIARTDISVHADGERNSAGSKAAGADVESGHAPEERGGPQLAGLIEVSIACPKEKVEIVRNALVEAGSHALNFE